MPYWMTSPWLFIVIVLILAAFLLAWRAVERKPDRAGQRIGLWIAALIFTFYGPFSAAAPAWPPTIWAEAINAERDFKDLWLAMIAMLVFSFSNISDNLIREYKEISKFSKFMTPILLAVYFGAIGIGMAQYKTFSGNVLTDGQFNAYWTIVWGATALGIFWELVIALECK